MLGHAKLSTTALYTRVSNRHLKAVHSLTHPGAKLERPATAETKTEPSPTPTETIIELHVALDAEAAEETTGVDELGSTTAPPRGRLEARCSRSKPM
jgi:integrase/recombinase XerD